MTPASRGRTGLARRFAGGTAALVAAASLISLAATPPDNKDDNEKAKRATLVVKVNPAIAFSPARVVATADLRGGSDADAELYCPGLEWDWGDGTKSEATQDCEPFEAGKSTITRRWSGTHTYTTSGNYRLQLRLTRGSKSILAGNTNVQVKPGVRDFGGDSGF